MLWQFGPTTTIVIGAGAAPPVQRAATYLRAEIAQRTGWRWAIEYGGEARPNAIVLGIRGDDAPSSASPLTPIYPEEITLATVPDPNGPTVYALAGGPSVALAATGRLARSLDLRSAHAGVPALSLRERPAYPVRGHTFANHKQNTTHDKWDWDHWETYLTELAAWGSNIAVVYPLHPARWKGALPFDDPPWFDMPARQAEYERQIGIQTRIPGLCGELGMRYGVWLPSNDIFPEEVVRQPELTKYNGWYVCPNIPEARARIRAVREHIFAMLPNVDVLFIPSKDDGGCHGCEQCTPWLPVYLELVQEQIAQARRYHPHCRVWLTQQGLSASETWELLAWIDRERPGWLEGLAVGPQSEAMTFDEPSGDAGVLSLQEYRRGERFVGTPGRPRAALPAEYRLVLYPDETHTFRCQYPVFGMDPAVQLVWDRQNGPSPRAREMATIHAATAPFSDGSAPYCEGDTDDLNKHVWSARDWDPALSGEQIALEYARWYFGADVAHDAAAILLGTEAVLNAPLYGNSAVPELRAMVADCEGREPTLIENWRWLNLRLGVLMLDHIQRVVERDRRLAAEVRYRVASWQHAANPLPGLRASIASIEQRFAETDGLLREIVATRDRLFARHKLAVRGVAALQNSYMRFDILIARWREVVVRVERGELASYPDRHAALTKPLRDAEVSVIDAMRGIALVDHIQEFAWEQGATTWS
ncbi:MAG: hypothetical protein ACRDJH_12725 [Thermomicrobiales bacterium]